jgi:DHA2 family multidrug resistance protein-like MFS transporter
VNAALNTSAVDPRSLGARRWWALGALSLAVLAVGIDGTVLSVALPTLAGALHASESDLQWFSSGYLLVLAASMLPASVLGDRYGRKKVLLCSLVLFAVGSAACAAASTSDEFIAARVLVGFAGAGIIVMSLAAITTLFSEAERPRAIGIWAAANFVAFPIGPILGGWILTNYWWGWVFLLNVPVALIGLVAAFKLVPEARAHERPALDLVGVGASVVGLVALVYGLIEAGEHGWSSPAALLEMVGGVAVLALFVVWERRLSKRPDRQPLIDVALFRSRSYTWGVILAAVAIFAMIGVLFTMPQYFQGVLGTTAMGSGLRLLSLIAGLVLAAVSAARIAHLVGAKVTVALGFAILAAGLLIGTTTSVSSSGTFVAAWMAIVGVGMGLAMATSTSAALSELADEQSGVGSAVLQAVNKVPLGAAVLGSVLSSAYLTRLDVSALPASAASAVRESIFGAVAVAHRLHSSALLASARIAFVHGMDLALLVAGCIAVLGVVLAAVFLPRTSASQAPERTPPAKAPAAIAAG